MSFYTGHLDAASNRADLRFQVELFDPQTNDFVDFTGSTINVALQPQQQQTLPTPTLTGTNLDGHVTIIGLGVFEVHFTRAEMTQFQAGTINVGITFLYALDGNTYQLFSGQLPVLDGVVNL
jgi:hypothetical protein